MDRRDQSLCLWRRAAAGEPAQISRSLSMQHFRKEGFRLARVPSTIRSSDCIVARTASAETQDWQPVCQQSPPKHPRPALVSKDATEPGRSPRSPLQRRNEILQACLRR
mmetsp:Transcript_51967/g.139770  ORF Transcript_51967/g.139770 Transcript_51967/m.139770 type:complete len:109 (-) Transcript_51967:51-377(-)